jgi:hypothetical protein
MIIEQYREERQIAVDRATVLGFRCVANEFRTCLEDPSLQYVRSFVRRFRITFSPQQI